MPVWTVNPAIGFYLFGVSAPFEWAKWEARCDGRREIACKCERGAENHRLVWTWRFSIKLNRLNYGRKWEQHTAAHTFTSLENSILLSLLVFLSLSRSRSLSKCGEQNTMAYIFKMNINCVGICEIVAMHVATLCLYSFSRLPVKIMWIQVVARIALLLFLFLPLPKAEKWRLYLPATPSGYKWQWC